MRKMAAEGATVAEIAKVFSIHPWKVGTICKGYLTRAAVRKREWTRTEDAMLGTMSDQNASRLIGVTQPCVSKRRKELGVAAYKGPRLRRKKT